MKKNKKDDIRHIYDASLFNITDLDVLLHETLKQTRHLLCAEAGSIYIKEKEELTFNVFQNDTLSYEEIYKQFYTLKDIKLPISEQEKYLAVESLLSQKIILIDDVYTAEEYDFLGVKEFDKRFNYKTQSIITAPLIHPMTKEGLGVVQILNKMENGSYTSFDEKDKTLLSMVCSFIALSVSKAKQDVKKLKTLNDKLIDSNKNLEKKVQLEILKNEKKSATIHNQAKMVSMGEMIGNIAHQWRQPLNAISTLASGLNINVEFGKINNQEICTSLSQIVNTTAHLSQTIDDFRNFYLIKKYKETFNISDSIKSCLNILDATISTNEIKIISNFDQNVSINGLKNEFTQAIINIIANAKDALLEHLSVEVNRYIFIDVFKLGQQIIIKIKDNAGGIDAQVLEKIFDQHFTTKKDKGSGIGLFMCKQIIQEHMDGELYVENKQFEYMDENFLGAQFSIILNQDEIS